MSVLVEFAMFPTDVGESKSEYVSRILKMIKDSGYNYQLTPMGTIIEAESLPEILAIIEKAYSQLEPDCNRVYSTIKLDIRKEKSNRLKGKVESVEKIVGTVKK